MNDKTNNMSRTPLERWTADDLLLGENHYRMAFAVVESDGGRIADRHNAVVDEAERRIATLHAEIDRLKSDQSDALGAAYSKGRADERIAALRWYFGNIFNKWLNARSVALSDAARAVGMSPIELSDVVCGLRDPLTDEQIDALYRNFGLDPVVFEGYPRRLWLREAKTVPWGVAVRAQQAAALTADPQGQKAGVMRTIEDHKVPCDAPQNQLTVQVTDDPGSGGAHHKYMIYGGAPIGTAEEGPEVQLRVSFQNGPIKENGVNGVTHEALLAVVIDRLRCFQAGPFACRENALALTNLEQALMWLQRRTADGMLTK